MINRKAWLGLLLAMIPDPQVWDMPAGPARNSNPFEGSGRSGKKGNCTNRTPATTKKRKAKRQASNTSKRSNR